MSRASGSATETLVINTGPLIAFARGGVLDEVGRLPLRFLCPTEVQEEIKQGVTAGYPPINPSWLSIEALTQPVSPVLLASLGAGEAAVIQLAQLYQCFQHGKRAQVPSTPNPVATYVNHPGCFVATPP